MLVATTACDDEEDDDDEEAGVAWADVDDVDEEAEEDPAVCLDRDNDI